MLIQTFVRCAIVATDECIGSCTESPIAEQGNVDGQQNYHS